MNKPPQPMTLERALAFVMPIGRYKGKTLGEIQKLDPLYLRWVSQNFKEGSAMQRATQFLVAFYREKSQ